MIEIRPGRRLEIFIHQVDPSRPTIFLIHGLGGRGFQWREQIKYFRDSYNLIVPDMLGQGSSEKLLPRGSQPYTFSELNQDVQALFEQFAGERNYVFGHSYGGAMSSFLALKNQNKIQKLVLISPVICGPFKAVPLVYLLPTPLLNFLRSYLDKSFEKLAFTALDDPELLRIEKEGRDANNLEIIKAVLMGMEHIPKLDVGFLKVPSLIIAGREDKIIPPVTIDSFYSQLPHHRMFILEGASHMVHLERSEEVNSLLDNFLR